MVSVEGKWTAEDAQTCEYEVRDFLSALVNLLKPEIVVETGCYLGHTTAALARPGVMVHACDLNPNYAHQAHCYVDSLGVQAKIHHSAGVDLIRSLPHIDFALLDSGGDRVKEAEELEKKQSCKLFALHDSNHLAWDKIRDMGWREIKFNTHRGLSLFQRGF